MIIPTSDPMFIRWQAEGAPTCGAAWEECPALLCYECEDEIQAGTEHLDDDGRHYHPGCCPGCDAEDEGLTLYAWSKDEEVNLDE